MKTRLLKDGRTVTARANGGLRKRCPCPRSSWVRCGHPWHANFSHDGREHRTSLHVYARKSGDYQMLKTEAQTLFTRWKVEVEGGKATRSPGDKLTLGDVCDKYLEGHVRLPTRRARATKDMEQQVDWLRRTWGNVALDALTKGDIETWRLERRAQAGRAADARAEVLRLKVVKEPVSAALLATARLAHASKGGEVWCNRLLTRLRHLYAFAIEHGLTETSPFVRHGVTVIRLNGHVEQPRARRLEGDEERRLLDASGVHLRAVIEGALETGCRRGELLALQWRHIRNGAIELPAELTKSGRSRVIPITARLQAVLQMRRHAPDGQAHPPSAFVFGDQCGGRITSVKTAWKLTCQRAGIRGLHLHDIRRESGSRLLEVTGVNVADVRDWLGHTSITTTSKYLATTAARMRQVLDKVEASRTARTFLAHEPNTTGDADAPQTVN